MNQTFSLGQVLSITTGRLCCDMGGVYEILNHITGDNLFTDALPRACRFAAPLVLEQHPELAIAGSDDSLAVLDADIQAARVPMEGVRKWMERLPLKPEYEITSHADQWETKHPMAELAEEMGEDRVKARCVVVAPKESTEPTTKP